MPEMEGTLYKWTNYLAGWQPRWFVLDKGILAYYKSKEEISQGSKGSVKMACCEIQVHPSDSCRLDLIIPGEQHFYVRGSTPAERQQWLVALGSAKACLTDFKLNQKQGVSHQSLRTKMSELRLYCDLLMQQVASVKAAAETPGKPDVEKLSGSTSLLTATCETFIKTLQDCMTAANETFTPHLKSTVTSETVVPPSPVPYLAEKGKKNVSRSHSVDDRYTPPPNKSGVQTKYKNLEEIASRPRTLNSSRQRTHSGGSRSTSAPSTPSDVPSYSSHHQSNSNNPEADQPLSTVTLETLGLHDINSKVTANGSAMQAGQQGRSPTTKPTLREIAKDHSVLEEGKRMPTFFSTMPTSFVDIQLASDGGIPTAVFLEACVSIVSIFDSLNSTAFAPVKMDINGNIRKLRQKYATDTQGFATLQAIVEQEVKSQTTMVKNSATDALMWLRRALEFIREFLVELINGETDLCQAAVTAYSKSLKPYHGWVVRGVFALAAKALPTYDNFLSFMLVDKAAEVSNEGVRAIKEDMEMCTTAMGVVISILQQYYTQGNLEVEEIV